MDGIVVINKPKGLTSQDTVTKVKHILNVKKAGHIGTLDPLATGVFPVLLGNATKASKYLMDHDKCYTVKLKFGIKTDTADFEGNIIKEESVGNISIKSIKEALGFFKGKYLQTPPMYSAIKVNGKKLYEYARKGINVDIPKREVMIYDIEFLRYKDEEKEIEFKVKCSKGTYIRTLCEDIAEKLGTIGTLNSLIRTQVGNFKIEDSISLDDLSSTSKVYTLEEVFKNYPKIKLESNKKDPFLNGVKINVKNQDGVYNVNIDGIIGLGKVKNGELKRDIIF